MTSSWTAYARITKAPSTFKTQEATHPVTAAHPRRPKSINLTFFHTKRNVHLEVTLKTAK